MRSHAKVSSAGSTSARGIGALGFALVVALLLGLTISPAAQAARGVINSVGENGYGGGQFSFTRLSGSPVSIGGVDINHTGNGSGADASDVYLVDRLANRVEQLSSSGDFIRAWGYDVVGSGADNTGANEQQAVTVPATVTGGTFTLTVTTATGQGSLFTGVQFAVPKVKNYSTSFGSIHVGDTLVGLDDFSNVSTLVTAVQPESLTLASSQAGAETRTRFEVRETTAPIPFNASAASVQAALEALPGIDPGAVTVSGGPGASAPFTVTFNGAPFAGNDVPQMEVTSSLTGDAASVETAVAGGGIEVCKAASSPADVCKDGSASPIAGAMSNPRGLAIDQATGNLFVPDQGNRRVDVFSSDGSFQGAFGWGVDTGAEALEFCTTASTCQEPAAFGGEAGQFSLWLGQPAVAPAGAPNAGNVLIPDPLNNRINEFSLTLSAGVVTGASFVRAFGWNVAPTRNEEQTVTLAGATGGTFTLTFSGQTTTPIAFDAPPSGAGGVEEALQALSNAGTDATVTGAAGGPYTVTFAGTKAGIDQPQMTADASALAPPGASVGVATTVEGSGNGTELERCTVASTCQEGAAGSGAGQFSPEGAAGVAEDSTGAIYVLNRRPGENSDCGPGERCTVQKFNPAATSASDFAPAQLTRTSGSATKEGASALAVDPSSGDVYVAQGNETNPPEVRVHRFDSAGNLLGTDLSGFGIGWQGLSLDGNSGGAGRILTPVEGLAYDPGTDRTVLGTTGGDEQAHLFFVDEIPASAAQTLSANLDGTPITDLTADSAEVHGSVSAAQGMESATRYEFEYTNGTIWTKTPLGDAGNGSGAGDPSSCPTANPTSCIVSVELSDLEAGQDYRVRLHAYVPFNPDLSVISPVAKFKIGGTGPTAETSNAWWSSPAATKPNLIMSGFVNPRNEVTSYYFQYVSEEDFQKSGFAKAASAPPPPGDPAAQSFRTVEVQQTVYEADPSPAYRYRLVAVSPSGTTFGDVRTVEPPKATDRFYELVSNGDSSSLATSSAEQLSDQGNRALFYSQIFTGQTAAPTPVNPKVAQRTPSGWKVTPPLLDPDYGYVGGLGTVGIGNGFQPGADLTRLLFEPAPGNVKESSNGRAIFQMAGVDGTTSPATPLLEALTREPGSPGFSNGESGSTSYPLAVGGSADLSRVVIYTRGGTTILPGEPLIPRIKPYLVNTETRQISLLNVDSAGNMIGGVCGAQLGGTVGFFSTTVLTNAVSLDGRAMYFSARPGAPSTGPCSFAVQSTFGTRIFKRVNETTTTEVSKSQCNRTALPEPPGPCKDTTGNDGYLGASADGDVAFFSSSRQLTNSDVDTGEDLYVYDATPPAGQPTLVQASAGEATAGHPTVGSGAGFLGLVDMAADGSRVYFVATGQLTADAVAGQNNLFVYERDAAHPTGRIEFVATLSNTFGEFALWGGGFGVKREAHALPSAATDPAGQEVYGDGRFLVFTSATKLVPDDTDSAKDLYRYADATGQLICLSCAGNEEKPVRIMARSLGAALGGGAKSNPGSYQQSRIASEDVSKVVFATEEGLDPEDHNGVEDAYLWDEGQLDWISRDTGDFGAPEITGNSIGGQRPTISLDGKDVFFATAARLVPSEVDTDVASDLYDARIGGGFPAPKPEARICADGEVCRGKTTAAPAVVAAGSSLAGPGNSKAAPKKARCRKGKVRRQGRCVSAKAKKKKQHKRSHKRDAHRNARGSK